MATCTDIDIALARLEAKIDAIPKVDEQGIIQKSVIQSESLLRPDIVAFGTTASLALTQANSAQKAVDIVKGVADDALKIGGQALSKAGQVAGGLADLFGKFSGLLGTVLNLVATVAAFAILANRIDGLEAEVNALREVAGAALNKANEAAKSANEAIAKSNEATTKANAAIAQSNDAISKANLAIGTSQDAKVTANKATDGANAATLQANKAIGEANSAKAQANSAVEKANGAAVEARKALDTSNSANYKAEQVAGELPGMKSETRRVEQKVDKLWADIDAGVRALHADLVNRIGIVTVALTNALRVAFDELNTYIDTHSTILRRHDQDIKSASGQATKALNEVNNLKPPVANATNTANNAIGQIPPLKLLSEKAYADALKAYNKVETDVPPVVNGIEQVRRANQSIRDQFKNVSQGIQQQFRDINSTIQQQLKVPSQTISNQQKLVEQQIKQTLQQNINQTTNVNTQDTALLKQIQSQLATLSKTAAPTTEQIKEVLKPELLAIPAAIGTIILPRLITPAQVKTASKQGTCEEAKPGGCLGKPLGNLQNSVNNNGNLLTALNTGLQAGQGALLTVMNNTLNAVNSTVNTVNTKLGAQLTGGLSGGLSRLSNFLGIDRIFNLLNFLATLHNASMLTASLKVTLLEMLSSVGNATGLLETSEGDNVELNKVFDKGIEQFIVLLVGRTTYAQMTLAWKTYNPIYRAATNSLNAITSMFNSIGDALETVGEYTGKVGNALRAAGAVHENAYQAFSEKINAKSSRFMRYETRVGQTTQILEAINEIAENVVEGQQQYTEAVKQTKEFKELLEKQEKNPGISNKAIAEEVKKQKENATKDPTGEDEKGLLSFLTDL